MLAAIRRFFRTPALLTRQRQQGAGPDDPDLEASSSVGEADQQTDDIRQQHQHQHAGDDVGGIKGWKKSRSQKQAAKLDSNCDRRRASGKLAGALGANKSSRVPACGGLGDSSSDSSASGSSSSSSSSSSDTTSSSTSTSSSSSCGSGLSGNNSGPSNTAANLNQDEARLHLAVAAPPAGEGQLAIGVAECGDCPRQLRQLQQSFDVNEPERPTREQSQTRVKSGKGFNFNFEDDDEEEESKNNQDEADNDEDDDNFTAEDPNRVSFIANANRQNHYHHSHHHSQQVTTSPTNSSVQANAAASMTMPAATFHAAVTPGTMTSCASRKTDVDQLLTGATSVANQRRDSVRGNLEELRVAESVNYRPVVYKYSFKIPDTPVNMRVFTDPDDRRIEAIARSCDSQIHLERLPVRPGVSGSQGALKMRKITIQSPDLHSLEKCCRQFDDRFKHFYVSGGLGLSGKSIQRVYVDELDN